MRKGLLALAAALILPAAASAQQIQGIDLRVGTHVDMMGVDKNSDRRVTREEAQQDPELARQFDQLDTDGNGELEQAELARFEAEGKAKAKGSGNTPESRERDREVEGQRGPESRDR